jgi:hypothetical protein
MVLDNNQSLSSSRWAPASVRRKQGYNDSWQRQTSPASDFDRSSIHNSLHTQRPINNLENQPPLPAAQRNHLTRQQSYNRFTRLLLRLRHKSLLLQFSHHRALNAPDSASVVRDAASDVAAFTSVEVETMFRVDFYEWYVLLERCLIALLDSVGVAVQTGYDPQSLKSGDGARGRMGFDAGNAHAYPRSQSAGVNGGSTDPDPLIGDAHAFSAISGYPHRFHESVLDALDVNSRNPVHSILGTGKTRDFIGVAKEFRNRWKELDVTTGSVSKHSSYMMANMGPEGASGDVNLEVIIDRKLKRYEKLLKDLNLDEMLIAILEALQQSRSVAEMHLQKAAVEVGMTDSMQGRNEQLDMELKDAPFEAGVDAMEWD